MAKTPIEAGSVVILNSGGPHMTVSSVGSHEAIVEWLVGDGTKGTARFKLPMLTNVKDVISAVG